MRPLFITLALFGSTAALAADVKVDDCIIQEVLPGKHATGAFAKFDNREDKAVVLKTAAIDSLSKHVELHKMVQNGDVMSMQQIHEYDLNPGVTEFKKGGYHIMIMDIDTPPAVGSTHEITFTFADGTTASCTAPVMSVEQVMQHFGADQAAMHNMQHNGTDMGNAAHGQGTADQSETQQ